MNAGMHAERSVLKCDMPNQNIFCVFRGTVETAQIKYTDWHHRHAHKIHWRPVWTIHSNYFLCNAQKLTLGPKPAELFCWCQLVTHTCTHCEPNVSPTFDTACSDKLLPCYTCAARRAVSRYSRVATSGCCPSHRYLLFSRMIRMIWDFRCQQEILFRVMVWWRPWLPLWSLREQTSVG